MRASSVSEVTCTYLWRSCQATVCRSRPETGRPKSKGPEGERLARLTREGQTETPTEGVLCTSVKLEIVLQGLGDLAQW
ncbi:rCG50615 [Rattus norvegicus]|uniref:RCG50615 n=1 Tax=Rattus norvegicus TaxID=10116 RepID=A6KCH8_RAT|nr:rCG50615 [Rattus norvegicus]